MRKLKDKQQSISKQLVKSYLLLFPLFIALICLVIIIASVISHSLLLHVIPTHEYNLKEYMHDDVNAIDISNLIESGGGGAIVYSDGKVQELDDTKVFDKNVLSKAEWTKFLTNASNPENNNVYSIEYNESKNFWLVVSTPVPIRFYASITANTSSPNFITALIFYLTILISIILLLFFIVLLYAKRSSKAFVNPLKNLCNRVSNMTNEVYNIEEDYSFNGEFLSLSNNVNKLSLELKHEKILREKLENEKKQILLDISHDLRNPLATIMGYADTLKNSNLDEDKKMHYIDVIYNNSIRANQLMDDLFMYSKLDAPSFNPNFEKYDLCEFIREQVSLFIPQFELKGINTVFEIPNYEIIMEIDKSLLSRALSNLFTNCIKYNQNPTTFTLSLNEINNTINLLIKDDGIGIDEDMKDAIFKPFIRSDKSRNSKTGGSGLGLAIVKKIINTHDGQIHLETKINEGCKFTISFNKQS